MALGYAFAVPIMIGSVFIGGAGFVVFFVCVGYVAWAISKYPVKERKQKKYDDFDF